MTLDKQTSIVIDSVTYTVPIVDIDIDGQFLYKYAERTTSSDFKSEAIGFVENQSITFEGENLADFRALYEALSTINSDGNYNKTVRVYSPIGDYDFEMYPDKLRVKMKRQVSSTNHWWGKMTVKFIATSKVR